MDKHPRYDISEAVARFFPSGHRYDRQRAQQMIDWLDSCGYRIVEKHDDEAMHEDAGRETERTHRH